jgi:hypothetical protein
MEFFFFLKISHLVYSRKNTATFGKITKFWKPQNWEKNGPEQGFWNCLTCAIVLVI